MAFRMTRSRPNDTRPEPMRKKRKTNTMFDDDDVARFKETSRKAEISVSQSLTADEKRIEMGRRLLAAAKESVPHSDDDDRDNGEDDDYYDSNDDNNATTQVHQKLTNAMLFKEGRFRDRMAADLKKHIDSNPKNDGIQVSVLRGHRLSVTCMALDPSGNDKYVITGSKDGSIIKWDLDTGKQVRKIWHAWPINNRNAVNRKTGKKLRWGGLRYDVYKKIRPRPVLALAISPDSKWLVSGGEDCLIRVWNCKTMRYKSAFKGGHVDKVTGLAFAKEPLLKHVKNPSEIETNNTLFSTGSDRQIRVYDMNEMGFAEPLYGHTLGINAIDSTTEDRCLTVSDDKTIRYWKLRTQSQLIFNNGHNGCIDACCIITPGRFVTGSQDGSIALWSTARKHPLQKQEEAHLSYNKLNANNKSKNGKGKGNNNKQKNAKMHWITCLSCKVNSDVFTSGSSDGVIRLWALKNNSFNHIRSVEIPKCGFVNCMKWTDKGDRIICGLGREHRLGRWECLTGTKNGIAIIKLPEFRKKSKKENADETNAKDVVDVEVEVEVDGDDDSKVEEKKYLKFEKANTWDKWNPRERGEFVEEKTVENAKSKKKSGKLDSFLEDEDVDIVGKKADNDEWNSFFGDVFDS